MANLLTSALLLRCPKCGRGKLFSGLLAIHEQCPACGFDLRAQDSGDGPVFFAMVIVEFIAMGIMVWLEFAFSAPLWLELPILALVIFGGTIGVLRLGKSVLIAMQYKHRILGFDRDTSA